MKKKILILIYILLVLVFLKQVINIFYNRYVLNFYNDHDYSINVNLLESLNIFESYIAPYNNGNILYKNKQYKAAYKKYEETLDCWDLPKDKECDVRVNMALCKVNMLDENYKDEEHIDESITILHEAQKILTKKGCAKESGKGHDKEAQLLHDEIELMILELELIKNPPPDQPTPTPDPSKPTPTPDPNKPTPTPDPLNPQPSRGPGDPTPTPGEPTSVPSPNPSGGPSGTPTPEPVTVTPGPNDPDNPDPNGGDDDTGEDGVRKKIKEVGSDAFKDRIRELEDYINRSGEINWDNNGIW